LRNPFPQSHEWFGAGQDLRQAVLAWQARLNPPVAADDKYPLTLDQLEMLLATARQAKGEEAAPKRLEHLPALGFGHRIERVVSGGCACHVIIIFLYRNMSIGKME
jgi:hypothetical protein